jgi:hypothetical protein
VASPVKATLDTPFESPLDSSLELPLESARESSRKSWRGSLRDSSRGRASGEAPALDNVGELRTQDVSTRPGCSGAGEHAGAAAGCLP